MRCGLLLHLLGHQNSIYSIVFAPDSKFLISASWDKTLKYWDLSDLTCINKKKDTHGSFKDDNTCVCTRTFVGHEVQLFVGFFPSSNVVFSRTLSYPLLYRMMVRW
jgi:WD40 repeat protein